MGTPPPAPDEPLPRDPRRLAERLAAVGAGLEGSIDEWVARGDPSVGPPPPAVTLGALYEQRAYRLLARLTPGRVLARGAERRGKGSARPGVGCREVQPARTAIPRA